MWLPGTPRPALLAMSKKVSVKKDQGHGTKTGGLNMQPYNSLMWWESNRILPPCSFQKNYSFHLEFLADFPGTKHGLPECIHVA